MATQRTDLKAELETLVQSVLSNLRNFDNDQLERLTFHTETELMDRDLTGYQEEGFDYDA